ncbi:hypothetical protein CCGE525_01450 [Rhizobium jaguaris]|uniref:DUF1311 domain-containing protein n=1 Tax=Rhizobium jaguaris TaxID=1312183 RepID=A0A387FNU8_9HYPH|nr:hypothetical protein CCGE525_01450 [Rhizobium jaguaris]
MMFICFQSKGVRNLRFLLTILTPTLFAALAILALADHNGASAEDLPQYDSSAYCQDLTSKMLVKSEEIRETLDCMYWEGVAKAHLEQHWSLVSPVALKECMKIPRLSEKPLLLPASGVYRPIYWYGVL